MMNLMTIIVIPIVKNWLVMWAKNGAGRCEDIPSEGAVRDQQRQSKLI